MSAHRPLHCSFACLALGLSVGCQGGAPAPTPGVPAAIRLVAGESQSGIVGQELPLALVVELTDAQGSPVAHQIVNFRVVSGGGSVFAGTTLTNSAGRGQERWTLGTNASEQQVLEARAVDSANGAPLVFARFSAIALPDSSASVLAASGDTQIGMAGLALASPLVVRVADKFGNPVPSVDVVWVVEDGGGALDASATSTDGSGQTSARWTLGWAALSQHVRAEIGLLSVRFSTAAVGGIPVSIGPAPSTSSRVAWPGTDVDPPVVLVLDVLRNPVPGVSVGWAVTGGGGQISSSSAATDASGRASCGSWTLGRSPGPNEVTASASGQAPVAFSASATLPAHVSRRADLINFQWALPGTDVAKAPAVVVTGPAGEAVSGVPVDFNVKTGGGAIRITTARTDAAGQASCGGWMLGSARGRNEVAASVVGLPGVTFTAFAGMNSPLISVAPWLSHWTVPPPYYSNVVGNAIEVTARVDSTNPISTVTGSIGSSTVAFSNSTTWLWGEILSGVGLFGPMTVVVTATDSLGNQSDGFLEVVVDRPPVVTVSSPAPEALARPSIEVSASCADDDPAGCTSLRVLADLGTYDGTSRQQTAEADCLRGASGAWTTAALVAHLTSDVTQRIDLSGFEGQLVNLCFFGTDSSGRWQSPSAGSYPGQPSAGVLRRVYVESSPKLALASTVPGFVLDASGTRVLYVDSSGATRTIRIHDTATGSTQEVASRSLPTARPWSASLTPRGALYVHYDDASYTYTAYDWRDGSTTVLGALNHSSPMVKVAGDYALLTDQARGLIRRDLNSGTDVVVATIGVGGDIAANGDVVYIDSAYDQPFRYRNGTATQISADPPGVAGAYFEPRTDGVTIVYWKPGASSDVMVIDDPSGEVRVSPATMAGGYGLAGGWVAYGKWSSLGVTDVWRHGPSGEEFIATGGASEAGAEAIGPDGTVFLHIGSPIEDVVYGRVASRLYRAVPGAALEEIASTMGTVVYRDGKFLLLLGASVLEVTP